MPLREDLLAPIPGDNPAGQNLRYAPVYDKIKEARREDDEGPQGVWQHERKLADWGQVIKLAGDALATKSKDLQLVVWLAEAHLRRDGIGSLQPSIELMRGLIENFWDGLYPELEDGDAEMRSAPLEWFGSAGASQTGTDRLELGVKHTFLTKGKLDYNKYKDSRAVPSEEEANASDPKRTAREQAIKEGKATPEEFEKDFAATPKKFYADLVETFDRTLESLAALGEISNEKFGEVAPSFGKLERVLSEVRQVAHILLQKKRETEPDEPAAPPVVEPEPESEPEAEPATEAAPVAAVAAPARAPARPAGSLPAEPVDAADAVARIVAVAKFLRAKDEYSPAPYLLLRGLRWGELRAGGAKIDQRLLLPPATEVRQQLKSLALESNWQEILRVGETAMGMECGRGWLDLQRYIVRALSGMGSWFDPIRLAVVSELKALLTDYPQLTEMTLMDDTATANAETLAWLKEEVIPPPPEPPAQSAPPEPEPAYAPPAWQQREDLAGAEAPPDAFDLAMQAARSGRPQEGIELLMRELAQERSGRARFQRKAQLAQLCVSVGHDAIAHPILQELAAEIERLHLEEWEAPDLIARPLALLYSCLGKDAPPEQRQKLYSWICRLDPLQAMTITR
ncbi:MAG: type VI secretion system protein TssA [Bryobacteraceae bacterium]